MILRSLTFLSCLLYLLLIAWSVQAQAFEPAFQKGDKVIRGRLAVVKPDTSGSFIPIGGDPYVSTSVVPEVDFSYFLADNIAVEAILGIIPHKAKALGTARGDRDGGRIYALAPTVILQYHHQIDEQFAPYVGLGMAYVKYFEDDTQDQLQYSDDITPVLQAGMNVIIDDHWHANFDIKRAFNGTEVKINGGEATGEVDIDPTIYGVGFGYRF